MNLSHLTDALHRDGLLELPALLPRPALEDLRADLGASFTALAPTLRERRALAPERLRGLDALTTNPSLVSVAEAVLGARAHVTTVTVQRTHAGAPETPWHRDDLAWPEHFLARRTTALVFELALDDAADAWVEYARGTQWDDGLLWEDQRVLTAEAARRWRGGESRLAWAPARGALVVRSPLLVYRETASRAARLTLQLRAHAR
jgi:hypothetical protein